MIRSEWFTAVMTAPTTGEADSMSILTSSEGDLEAVQWLKKSAEKGKASAQYALANMYYAGRGIGQDYQQALKWYQQAVTNSATDELVLQDIKDMITRCTARLTATEELEQSQKYQAETLARLEEEYRRELGARSSR